MPLRPLIPPALAALALASATPGLLLGGNCPSSNAVTPVAGTEDDHRPDPFDPYESTQINRPSTPWAGPHRRGRSLTITPLNGIPEVQPQEDEALSEWEGATQIKFRNNARERWTLLPRADSAPFRCTGVMALEPDGSLAIAPDRAIFLSLPDREGLDRYQAHFALRDGRGRVRAQITYTVSCRGGQETVTVRMFQPNGRPLPGGVSPTYVPAVQTVFIEG